MDTEKKREVDRTSDNVLNYVDMYDNFRENFRV